MSLFPYMTYLHNTSEDAPYFEKPNLTVQPKLSRTVTLNLLLSYT